jgi:Na+-transporting NADH:ubiquinone oxidoreductase subunit C
MFDTRTKGYAIVFSAVMSVVCCTLLTAAYTGLRPRQLANMELDRQRNILKAAGVLSDDRPMGDQGVRELYQRSIEAMTVDHQGNPAPTGAGLPLFLYRDKGRIRAYIIPIESRGLWGKISGYIAFEDDGVTVAGFSVYSHSETPGLGGEIEKAWFGKNFAGKRIVNRRGAFVSVGIAKGPAGNLPKDQEEHMVDGISGATLTGKYLTQGLYRNLESYEPVSIRFRQGRPLDARENTP